MNENTNPLHRPLAVGDWVIVGSGEEYAGLTGQVTEIIHLGSPEHDTGNPTDDIVVDLSLTDYSDNMKAEITALIRTLGYEANSYDDVSIDSVIIAPDDLIRIMPEELEQYRSELTASRQSADFTGEMLSLQHIDELSAALIDRVEENLADYYDSLSGFGNQELIEMAGKIAAMQDARDYMTTSRGYSDVELKFYLQFACPLEIVADAWIARNLELDEMSFTMDFLNDSERQKTALEVYPLYAEKPKPDEYISAVISEQKAEKAAPTPEKEPQKPTPQKSKQPYTLLGDLRETQAEVNARKAEKTAVPTKTKTKNQEEI